MAFNKIEALAAPPGHSLTDPVGKWAWDNPPQFADPNDAVDFVIDKMQQKNTQDSLLKMMAAGITIEEIVGQVAFKGFMQGMYTPDVAELIKPSVGIYLMKLATDNNIDYEITVPKRDEQEQMDDDTFFDIIKERNPVMYKTMIETANEQERMGKADLDMYMAEQRKEQEPPQNFLQMGDS
tara:strand:- start:2351 stop:2893 length:543 start_codon:yes stop_codon:yes gene_type:complete